LDSNPVAGILDGSGVKAHRSNKNTQPGSSLELQMIFKPIVCWEVKKLIYIHFRHFFRLCVVHGVIFLYNVAFKDIWVREPCWSESQVYAAASVKETKCALGIFTPLKNENYCLQDSAFCANVLINVCKQKMAQNFLSKLT